ncbi:hypothetical protein D3C81_1688070 [compost metagenome]
MQGSMILSCFENSVFAIRMLTQRILHTQHQNALVRSGIDVIYLGCVYNDLRRLGASNSYLLCCTVFTVLRCEKCAGY